MESDPPSLALPSGAITVDVDLDGPTPSVHVAIPAGVVFIVAILVTKLLILN